MKRLLRRAPASSESIIKGDPPTRTTKCVKAFCESGDPTKGPRGDDEVAYLPTIVDAAESSPQAALAAAHNIRKVIKDGYTKPYKQYNAIMLIRILLDNPGQPFTSNFDDKFVACLDVCLTQSKDPSVQQILRETLGHLEATKKDDPTLSRLFTMWQQRRGPYVPHQSRKQRPHVPTKLPPPEELSNRISEARTTAQLLIQLSHTTPAAEVQSNSLLQEFATRCQSANRDMQAYMACTDPAPDPNTFQSLIETCEQLNFAISKHQRAVLASRQVQAGSSANGSNVVSNALPSPPVSRSPPLPSQPDFQAQQRTSQAINPFADDGPADRAGQDQGRNSYVPAPNGRTGGFNPSAAVGANHNHDDDDDLYNTSNTPVKPALTVDRGFEQSNRTSLPPPGTGESQLSATNRPYLPAATTASFINRQDNAVNSLAMSGGQVTGTAEEPSSQQRRIKDDEPFNVDSSAWRQ